MTNYKIDFSKGLVPAILQDNQTKQVLMLGYMNQEAFEVVIEAIKGDKKAFVSEVADELYHLFVLMHALGVDFSEIEAELARRHHKRNNFKGERQNIEQW